MIGLGIRLGRVDLAVGPLSALPNRRLEKPVRRVELVKRAAMQPRAALVDLVLVAHTEAGARRARALEQCTWLG